LRGFWLYRSQWCICDWCAGYACGWTHRHTHTHAALYCGGWVGAARDREYPLWWEDAHGSMSWLICYFHYSLYYILFISYIYIFISIY
jgi:hypothetical protein